MLYDDPFLALVLERLKSPYAADKLIAVCILWLSMWICSDSPADIKPIKMASIFADNMMLQKDQENQIWGVATPRDKIAVSLGTSKALTSVSTDGTWSVRLPALSAGGPYDLKITGVNSLVIHNVLIGDVWLCSGQSNMAMPLSETDPAEINIVKVHFPNLRFFIMTPNPRSKPANEIEGHWYVANPQNASMFSAVAYHFAHQVHAATTVPIGIIQCAASASPIKAWISTEALGHTPRKSLYYACSSLYNGMIAPIVKFGIKGIIWYQGEAGIFEASKYPKLLASLVYDWRQRWRLGPLPFLCVQLPNYGKTIDSPSESAWAELRDAQYQACKTIPNAYLIVSIDTGGTMPKVHTLYKRIIGQRLALTALAICYEQRNSISFQSPTIDSTKVLDHEIQISFDKSIVAHGSKIEGFAIAGNDQKFYWAGAKITNNDKAVLVSSMQVLNPVAVRYAWADNPKCNLYSASGLPVVPFRTDSWQCPKTWHYDFSSELLKSYTEQKCIKTKQQAYAH